MNPRRVATRADIEAELQRKGFMPTGKRAGSSGEVWQHQRTGKSITVPDAVQDMYPEFILRDLREILERVGHSTETIH